MNARRKELRGVNGTVVVVIVCGDCMRDIENAGRELDRAAKRSRCVVRL